MTVYYVITVKLLTVKVMVIMCGSETEKRFYIKKKNYLEVKNIKRTIWTVGVVVKIVTELENTRKNIFFFSNRIGLKVIFLQQKKMFWQASPYLGGLFFTDILPFEPLLV